MSGTTPTSEMEQEALRLESELGSSTTRSYREDVRRIAEAFELAAQLRPDGDPARDALLARAAYFTYDENPSRGAALFMEAARGFESAGDLYEAARCYSYASIILGAARILHLDKGGNYKN